MSITAKYAGTCNVCAKAIHPGEKIEWKKGAGSTHLSCVGKQPVPLNSAPPTQMIPPDADLAALAAAHGRTIDGEPRLLSLFSDAGGKPGDIERIKGQRYLILAVGPSRYYSRTYLEDMDMFSMEPGRYSEAQAVRVLPTPEEAAEDAAKAARKQEAAELQVALRNSYGGEGCLPGRPAVELTEVWAASRAAGSESWYVGADGIVYHMRSDYDMGPSWWRTTATLAQIERAKQLGIKVVY